jgi:hypothetical protein
MAVYYREPADFAFGTLSVAAALGDTTLQSTQFTSLGTGYSAGANPVVLPIVLINTATPAREVVWVTGHTSASNSVTVVRGKEGTTAQAWPSGTQWICAPTVARDGLPYMSAATLAGLTDTHAGMRALEVDTGQVKEQTYTGGLLPSYGHILPGHIAGTSVPTTGAVQFRAGVLTSAVPVSGLVTATFSSPFPNGFLMGFAGSADHNLWDGYVAVDGGSTTSCKLAPLSSSGTPGSCTLAYLALGW